MPHSHTSFFNSPLDDQSINKFIRLSIYPSIRAPTLLFEQVERCIQRCLDKITAQELEQGNQSINLIKTNQSFHSNNYLFNKTPNHLSFNPSINKSYSELLNRRVKLLYYLVQKTPDAVLFLWVLE